LLSVQCPLIPRLHAELDPSSERALSSRLSRPTLVQASLPPGHSFWAIQLTPTRPWRPICREKRFERSPSRLACWESIQSLPVWSDVLEETGKSPMKKRDKPRNASRARLKATFQKQRGFWSPPYNHPLLMAVIAPLVPLFQVERTTPKLGGNSWRRHSRWSHL